MVIENQNTPVANEADEVAIKASANQLIASAAAKIGLRFEDVPIEAREDALNYARNTYAEEQARKSNPMFAENELLRQKLEIAEAQLFASKNARTSAASATSDNAQPAVSVDLARAKLGEYQWNHVLTPNTRLQSIGVQPSEVTPAVRLEIEEVFGSKSTSARASEMFRADPARYRRLREIGRCLRMI
jgi:hypothetical protein